MKSKGFTLVEAIFAIALVGLAIASLLMANKCFTQANGVGAELSTAEFLVEQIREMTAMMSYDALGGLDGQTFSPPVDADGQNLADLSAYQQQVAAKNVNPSNFSQIVGYSTDFVRVTVDVYLGSKLITSES